MADPAFHTPLIHESILAIRDPDAAKFLQGRLTCNLACLNDGTSNLGGRCDIKGHLLSNFRILPEGDGLLLATVDKLLEAQLTDLRKYAAFFKASLVDENTAWLHIGPHDASEALRALGIDTPVESGRIAHHGDLLAVALGNVRIGLWVLAQRAETVPVTLREHSREVPPDDWLLGQVRAGVGRVLGAARELFIPQVINLQAAGGVNFKKDCHTGQEIVACVQYLGRLERRLYRLALDADEASVPGIGLFSPVHSTSIDKVILTARTPENSMELLVVLQDDAAAGGRISLGSAEGAPLVLLNLPYTLGSDHEIQR